MYVVTVCMYLHCCRSFLAHLTFVCITFWFSCSQTTGLPVHGNATIELEIRPTGMNGNYPTIKKEISKVGVAGIIENGLN